MTVCASASWFVQVTVVPTLTVIAAGLKAKPLMVTAFVAAGLPALPDYELLEMVLSKADPDIAAYYDRVLVPDELRGLGHELRDSCRRTTMRPRR